MTLVPDAILAPYQPEGDNVWERHVQAWDNATAQTLEGMFKLAAIAASITSRYGKSDVQKFAYEVKVSTALIYERASTYRLMEAKGVAVRPILSYTHHKLAAATEEPERWLDRAEDEGWSSRQLEAAIHKKPYTPHDPGAYPLPTPEASRRLEHWKSYVRSEPCLVCGKRGGSHYAHFKGLVNHKTGEMENRKQGLSDYLGIPLCPTDHLDGKNSIHNIGEQAFFLEHFGGFDRLMGIYTRMLLEWMERWE